jgi:hypothetical protein
MKCLEYGILGVRDTFLKCDEICRMEEVFMIDIWVRNWISKKNLACSKTKIGFVVGFDFGIFEKNQFVSNKPTRYFCKVY